MRGIFYWALLKWFFANNCFSLSFLFFIDCPTTNEVFISLLVYFDRMSRLPNLSNLTSSLPSSNNTQQVSNNNSSNQNSATATSNCTSSSSLSLTTTPSTSHTRTRSSSNPAESTNPIQHSPHSTFAVDSFNIHRLIISGVTVASKFFSDVFYTNSRYAKVSCLKFCISVACPMHRGLTLISIVCLASRLEVCL